MDRVSVFICSYQQAKFLSDAIGSATTQTLPPHEVVVVCGDDESVAVAKLYRSVRIVRDPGKGAAHARNLGVQETSGDRLVCLDADDVLDPNFLKETVPIDADIVGTWMKNFGDHPRSGTVWEPSDWSVEVIRKQNLLVVPSLFRRFVWEKVGGYHVATWMDDWDFWVRASKIPGLVVKTVRKHLLLRRLHGENATIREWRHHIEAWNACHQLLHPDLYQRPSNELISSIPDWFIRRIETNFPDDPEVKSIAEAFRSSR